MSSVPPPPPPPPPSEWVVPPEGLVQPYAPPPESGPSRRPLRWFSAAGLIVAGVLVGGAVALAVNNHNDGSRTTGATTNGVGQNGAAQNGVGEVGVGPNGTGGRPALGGGFGGRPGEQHVQGTLTAIGSNTVTVKTATGSTVYAVTSVTQIVRNGAAATLAQLKVGDPVEVHALSSTTAGHKQLERIFAGTLPARGGPGDGGGPGGPVA